LNSLIIQWSVLSLSNNPKLCRDPNANYGTRAEIKKFPVCSP